MNLPTKLTFLRILMIPLFVTVFFVEFTGHRFVATGIFALACFTDYLDGYIARKYNLVTNLGKFLDPIADKLLVACGLIAVSIVPPFDPIHQLFGVAIAICTMIILCRELLVSGFRIVASSKNIVLAADKLGKIKTVFQMFSMLLLIPYVSIYNTYAPISKIIFYVGFALLCLASLFTVLSGANYIIKNREILKD